MSEEKKNIDEQKSENGNTENESKKNSEPVTAADYTGMPGYEEAEDPAPSVSAEAPETPKKSLKTKKEERDFSREEWILTHIGDENLMEYLELERKREELLQKTKEERQKRILSAFQLAVSLAAVVGIIWLLRDNPTVMVNILYIIGIVGAVWIWRNPKSK